MAAEPRGSDRLHHRLLGADRLDHRVRAEPVGEVRDPRDAVVPSLLDDVGRAELEGELLPIRVAAHRDDPLGAELPGGKHPEQLARAVTN